MGTRYTTQGITGYNADPPPDDGTTGTSNKVAWVNHIDKIGDPIKTQAAAIDTAILNMVDVDTVAYAANYTTVEDDNGRVLECTASPDITLGLAATMGSGYKVTVKTVSGTTTVSLGGADEIDGSTSDRTLIAGVSETYVVNEAEDGFLLAGGIIGALTHSGANFEATGGFTLGEATNIPAAATQVIVSFVNLSIDGSGGVFIELGDSSYSYDAHESASVYDTSKNPIADKHVLSTPSGSTDTVWGTLTFTRISGTNSWSCSGTSQTTSDDPYYIAGGFTATGVVDRVRLTSSGNTFLNGTASVYWN